MAIRQTGLGDVPKGLTPHHTDFLRKVRDSIDILYGKKQASIVLRTPTATEIISRPGTQAVTLEDLRSLGLLNEQDSGAVTTAENQFARIFMHMGAL